jgi:hypothetical protein
LVACVRPLNHEDRRHVLCGIVVPNGATLSSSPYLRIYVMRFAAVFRNTWFLQRA